MKSALVQVGSQVVNVAEVAAAHWEGSKLWVHFVGGRFLSFQGDDAKRLWSVMAELSTDLHSGEVKGSE